MRAASFEYALETASATGAGDDRACVLVRTDRLVIALADGAGGTGGGALAAQALIDAVAADQRAEWCELIEELDRDPERRGHGETTAVIVSIGPLGITGASVGDSGAWLVGDQVLELTARQERKPLVGGGCFAVGFDAWPIGSATLVVASDGLFRYARSADIARIAQQIDLAAAARALVDLVRLPTGQLQDDVAIVLCRGLPEPALR